MQYTVTWAVEVEAETPSEAVLSAHALCIDPEKRTTFYDVIAFDAPEGTEPQLFQITDTLTSDPKPMEV